MEGRNRSRWGVGDTVIGDMNRAGAVARNREVIASNLGWACYTHTDTDRSRAGDINFTSCACACGESIESTIQSERGCSRGREGGARGNSGDGRAAGLSGNWACTSVAHKEATDIRATKVVTPFAISRFAGCNTSAARDC